VVRSRKFRLNVPAGKIAADRKARIGRYVRIDRQSRADDGPFIFQEEAVAPGSPREPRVRPSAPIRAASSLSIEAKAAAEEFRNRAEIGLFNLPPLDSHPPPDLCPQEGPRKFLRH
jgi:hypothetical protein